MRLTLFLSLSASETLPSSPMLPRNSSRTSLTSDKVRSYTTIKCLIDCKIANYSPGNFLNILAGCVNYDAITDLMVRGQNTKYSAC